MYKAAFFDVDNTLIDMKSMFHFYKYWADVNGTQPQYLQYMDNFNQQVKRNTLRTILNEEYYQQFAGQSLDDIYHHALDWFNINFNTPSLLIDKTVSLLQQHKNEGFKIVFVSGSMMPLLKPLGELLNADAILCTTLAIDPNGQLTGNILPPQTIGEGKKLAMLDYAQKQHIDLTNSYSYGDDISDVPMLECVGHPVCVGHNPELMDYAKKMLWQHVSFD